MITGREYIRMEYQNGAIQFKVRLSLVWFWLGLARLGLARLGSIRFG